MNQSKAQLRHSLLQQRNQLSAIQSDNAAQSLSNVANSNKTLLKILANAKRILSYSAFQGELSAQFLLQNLTAKVYLPKIVDYQNSLMHFFPSNQNQITNRFGIAEPYGNGNSVELTDFDLIFTPLVGFDTKGNRLGLGAGFYDKALNTITGSKKPLLIGLAYDFQEVKTIKPDVWDVPLDVILTNSKIIDPTNKLLVV